MILYIVKYKLPGQLFYNKIKKVKGDGIVEHGQSRYFILEDETRVEIPVTAEFIFSKERYSLILERGNREAGQNLQINKK